jgi:hypothetical protein
VPLREIAPEACHPVLGRTAEEMARACGDKSQVERAPLRTRRRNARGGNRPAR